MTEQEYDALYNKKFDACNLCEMWDTEILEPFEKILKTISNPGGLYKIKDKDTKNAQYKTLDSLYDRVLEVLKIISQHRDFWDEEADRLEDMLIQAENEGEAGNEVLVTK